MKKAMIRFGKFLLAAAVLVGTAVHGMPVCGETEKTEGPGFGTPQEAASAYIEALCRHDLDAMLRACAVESYVDHFDMVQLLSVYKAVNIYNYKSLPANNPYARDVAVENRRTSLVDTMRWQFLSLIGSDILYGPSADRKIPVSDYASVDTMTEGLFPSAVPELSFKNEFIPPLGAAGQYYSSSPQWNSKREAGILHADSVTSLLAVVYAGDTPGILALGLVCYDEKWFVTNFFLLADMMGMGRNYGGLVLGYLDDEALDVPVSALTGLTENPQVLDILQRASACFEEIRIDPSVQDIREWETAYNEQLIQAEEKLKQEFTPEEYAIFDMYYRSTSES